MDLIYIEHSSQEKENAFFSREHGTFFRTDDILGNKVSPGKFKKIEIPKHFFWPQFYETRNQLHEEDCKKNINI